MQNIGRVFEEVKVQAQDLVEKVKELIHEGNVRRLIIKDDHGAIFMEVPLTVATVGVILAPVLAAVGAIATAGKYAIARNPISNRFRPRNRSRASGYAARLPRVMQSTVVEPAMSRLFNRPARNAVSPSTVA